MKSTCTHITMAILLLLGVHTGYAQDPDTVTSLPGIEISTTVDKAEIYIGDLIEYVVSITYDSSYKLVPPPLGANLGAFDVKDYQPDIETELDDGRLNSKTIFKLSTFTTGDYVIPPLPVIFTLPDSSVKVMLAEPVPIKVQSLLLNVGDTVDIKPLKDPYEFKRDYTTQLLIAGGVFLLLVLAVILWLWVRSRRRAGEPIDDREAWEIAFERLALLDQSNLLTEGSYKQYYIELSEILREFLGKAFSVDVLEMTTEQFLEAFKDADLPEAQYNEATSFLQRADLVKFARHVPELDRTQADFAAVHQIVDAVRAEIERQRAIEAELRAAKQNRQPAEVAG